MNSVETGIAGTGTDTMPAAESDFLDTPLIQTTVTRVVAEIERSMEVRGGLERTLHRIRHQLLALEALRPGRQKIRHAAMLVWLLSQARAEVFSADSRDLMRRLQTAEDLLCACLADALRRQGGDMESQLIELMGESFEELDPGPVGQEEWPSEPNLPVLVSVNPRAATPGQEAPPPLSRRERDPAKTRSTAIQGRTPR